MRFFRFPAALGAAVLVLFPTAPLAGQTSGAVRSDPTGFHLGAALNGSALQMDGDEEAESGPGLVLELGYAFNRTFMLYVQGAGANVEMADFDDTYVLGHFDVGARISFRGPEAKVLPYLTVAYSGRAAEVDLGDPLTVTGTGPSVGGGLAIFISRSTAIDFGFVWTGGAFTEAEYQGVTEEIDLDATSGRFNVGLNWWAGR